MVCWLVGWLIDQSDGLLVDHNLFYFSNIIILILIQFVVVIYLLFLLKVKIKLFLLVIGIFSLEVQHLVNRYLDIYFQGPGI